MKYRFGKENIKKYIEEIYQGKNISNKLMVLESDRKKRRKKVIPEKNQGF